jgi:signal transduction histidine kinase/HPt (histidine-containing phosphotransfer) domain-containing protein
VRGKRAFAGGGVCGGGHDFLLVKPLERPEKLGFAGILVKRERKNLTLTSKATANDEGRALEHVLLKGRTAILYALAQPYLFLPFASLAVAAALMQEAAPPWLVMIPYVAQIAASVAAGRLKEAYQKRVNDDPKLWAKRYTILSAVVGTIWGMAAIAWFVPNSFAGQAYLVLAYLGMSTTEFMGRAAYRPAFVAHAATSLLPLAALLIMQGGVFQMLTAVLVVCFGGVLYTYSGTIAGFLDQSIILRYENAKLILKLSQEKREAETARDSARASERAKTSFITNISHEIRTPLNAILGMTQLLERSELEKSQRDHVKVVLEAGRGLKTLLDDIIALAQINEEFPTPPEEGTDAAQAARTVARLLQPNAWEKRLRLSVNVAAGLPRVAADPRMLRRVLLKLTSNAIKYTDRGSIEIALDAVIDDANNTMVRFKIADTGAGVAAHVLATIFEPFKRGDNSYARQHNGAGVGLAVAKRLVETMGGAIGVESEPGAGATFWITVPASRSGISDASSLADDVPPPGGLSVVAWIEDTATKAMLDTVLTPFGNRITFASSLSEAAALSARGGYSLLIAGAQAVDGLAAAPGRRTPILALAAHDEPQPDGADGALRWPAPAGALYSAIAAAMDGGGVKGAVTNAEDVAGAALDASAFADLEKSLGLRTLIDILQSYLGTAEELSVALAAAMEKEDWLAAGRVAQDIAGAAGGLGLTALTAVARALAQGARDGAAKPVLDQAAAGIYAEHRRAREALKRLYPDLAA